MVVAKIKNQIFIEGSGTVNTKGRKIMISIIDVIAIMAKPFPLFLTMVLQPAWQNAANKINKNTKFKDKSYWFYR